MPLNVHFMDGAEHYSRQDRKWKFAATNTTAPASGVAGAHGLVCDDSVWGLKRHSFPATEKGSTRSRVMFRQNSASNNSFILVQSESNTHLTVNRNDDGTIFVDGPDFTHTTEDTYALNTWFDFEFRCRIHNGGGSYLFKANGSIPSRAGGGIMAGSGLDTQFGADAFLISFCWGNQNLQTYTDNTVIELTGANLGTGQVETAWPSGAGDLTELAPSSLVPNWTLVNEAIGDDLTTYVESTGQNQRDCYTFPPMAISGSKFVYQVCGTAIHGASGNPTFHMRFFLRIDGEDYDGDIQHNVSTTVECYQECWSTNPATGDEWTEAEINSVQPGTLCEDSDIRITQVVREVAALTPTPDFAGFRNYCGSVDTDVN